MVQAVSHRSVTAVARLRIQVSPCVICGGQSGTGSGFSPSTSAFPCQYHAANAPHSSSSTHCLYHKDKRAKPEYLTKSTTLTESGHHWKQKNFYFSALKDYSRGKNVTGFPLIAWCLLTHPTNKFERKHTFSKYGITVPTACWLRTLFA
jgi:hypothetical protein